MYTYFEPDGPLLVFPMRGNRVRLIAQMDAPAGEVTQDALQRLVDQRAGRVLTITGSHWLATFEIHHAQVPAYRHGRVFLAGDAAHVHSPAGGQGMNTRHPGRGQHRLEARVHTGRSGRRPAAGQLPGRAAPGRGRGHQVHHPDDRGGHA
jgi:hypothetical protein